MNFALSFFSRKISKLNFVETPRQRYDLRWYPDHVYHGWKAGLFLTKQTQVVCFDESFSSFHTKARYNGILLYKYLFVYPFKNNNQWSWENTSDSAELATIQSDSMESYTRLSQKFLKTVNICEISVKCLWNICEISVKYLWNICEISVKCLLKFESLHTNILVPDHITKLI